MLSLVVPWVSIAHGFTNNITKGMGLYIHIPPCPPEVVTVSEDEEGGLTVLGTCPEKECLLTPAAGLYHIYSPSNQVWCPADSV